MQRESGIAIVLLDDRQNFAIDEFPRRLPHQAFIVIQQGIYFQEVDTGKARHVISADEASIVHLRRRPRGGQRRDETRAI
jgi:hypothetical protein